MSSSVSGMGRVLRELRGESRYGEGPVEVMTRTEDFNVINVAAPGGQAQSMPARTLVTFGAIRFREVDESDVWEFSVHQDVGPGAPPAMSHVFVEGKDIFMIKQLSRVAV